MNLLVTGANGFIGRAVASRVASDGHAVRAALRRDEGQLDGIAEVVRVGDLGADTEWGLALAGIDAVVHSSARVHVMRDAAANPLEEFRRVNVEGTRHLAREAAKAGVRRFVFLSSIKVNGEATSPGRPYRAADTPAPADPYGVSKQEAEAALWSIAAETGLEVTVIRPVLVYGAGAKGNFSALVRLVARGLPLPLGAIDNRRSMVAIDNLVDLVRVVIAHPAAAGETFLVSDGEDLSSAALVRRLARAMGTSVRLVRVPVPVLLGVARLAGRTDQAQRLCGSLQVDITATIERLGWQPPVSVDVGLARAVGSLR